MWVVGVLIILAIVGVVIITTLIITRVYETVTSVNDDLDQKTTTDNIIYSRINTEIADSKLDSRNVKDKVQSLETRAVIAMRRLEDQLTSVASSNDDVHTKIKDRMFLVEGDMERINDEMSFVHEEILDTNIKMLSDFTDVRRNINDFKYDVSASNDKWASNFADLHNSQRTLSEQLGSIDARQMVMSNMVAPILPYIASFGNDLMTLSNQFSKTISSQIQTISSQSSQILPRLNNIDVVLGSTTNDLNNMIKPSMIALSNQMKDQVMPFILKTPTDLTDMRSNLNSAWKMMDSHTTTIGEIGKKVQAYDADMKSYGDAINTLNSNVAVQNADLMSVRSAINEYSNTFNSQKIGIGGYTIQEDNNRALKISNGINDKDLVYLNSVAVEKSIDVRQGGQLTFASLSADSNNAILGMTANGLKIDVGNKIYLSGNGVKVENGAIDVMKLKIGSHEIVEEGGKLVLRDPSGTTKPL